MTVVSRLAHVALSGSQADIALNARLVHNLVNFVRRDAWPEGCRCNIEDLAGQPANLAHTLLVLGAQLLNLVCPDERSSSLGNAILRVIGMRYRLGNLASRGEWIDWSEGPGETESREWVEVAGLWIWFRNDLWWEEMAQNTRLCLVEAFMCGLRFERVSARPLGIASAPI